MASGRQAARSIALLEKTRAANSKSVLLNDE
jgi:hypothetical protein